MAEMRCLLDMDGVLTDFVKGICKAHGKSDPYRNNGDATPWPAYRGRDYFQMERLLGMEAEEFWKPCNREFWSGLEKTDDCDRLIELVEFAFGRNNIVIASSPSKDLGCMPGKLEWIETHLPAYRRRFLFGPQKYVAAGPATVLIDDCQDNIEKFQDYGGIGFLVPRPWNDRWESESRTLELLEQFLDALV